MNNSEKINMVMIKTGLTQDECRGLLVEMNWDIEKTLNTIEKFMNSLSGGVIANKAIEESIRNAGLYNKLSANLSNYNTMRGGTKGFKGFVFEELHATDSTIKGQITEVISNNGIADFKILNADGTYTYAQAKVGYRTTKVDWSLYEGQTIVIDKGNQELINSAKAAGRNVIESGVSEKEAQCLAKAMQYETKLTGNTNAVIVPKIQSIGKVAQQCHNSGIKSAKGGAAFGAGFSIGSNIVELIDGEKDFSDVAKDVAKDTVVAAGTGYVVGAAATAIGSTAIGTAAITAATTAGAAISGTAIGATAIAAGTAVTGVVTTVGVATTGAIAAAGTTIAATAAGTAVTGAAAAAGTAIAGSVAGTAVAAAGTAIAGTAVGGAAIAAGTAVVAGAVAAAPVVIAGAAVGGIFALGKKIFGK